jgi:hypothetical protein
LIKSVSRPHKNPRERGGRTWPPSEPPSPGHLGGDAVTLAPRSEPGHTTVPDLANWRPFIDDQDKALRSCTEVLGFVKKTELPLVKHRWRRVVSPQDPDGVVMLFEPDTHPAVGPSKEALSTDGIPFASFAVDDVPGEVERLKALGVSFTQEVLLMDR